MKFVCLGGKHLEVYFCDLVDWSVAWWKDDSRAIEYAMQFRFFTRLDTRADAVIQTHNLRHIAPFVVVNALARGQIKAR